MKNLPKQWVLLFLNERITQEADTEIITIERKETDESVGTDD